MVHDAKMYTRFFLRNPRLRGQKIKKSGLDSPYLEFGVKFITDEQKFGNQEILRLQMGYF